MTSDRIFYGYMALIGLAAGATLATVPQAQGFPVAPYFWILIAAGLFEIGSLLLRRGAPMLTAGQRVVGFGIGIALMVAIAWAAGATVRLI
jgi:hypothetical protein